MVSCGQLSVSETLVVSITDQTKHSNKLFSVTLVKKYWGPDYVFRSQLLLGYANDAKVLLTLGVSLLALEYWGPDQMITLIIYSMHAHFANDAD